LEPVPCRVASGEPWQDCYNISTELYDPRVNVLQLCARTVRIFKTPRQLRGASRGAGFWERNLLADLVGPLYRSGRAGWWHGDFYEFGGGRMVTADNRFPGPRRTNTWRNVSESPAIWRMRTIARSREGAGDCRSVLRCLRDRAISRRFPLMRTIMQGAAVGFAASDNGQVGHHGNLVNLGSRADCDIPGEALPI